MPNSYDLHFLTPAGCDSGYRIRIDKIQTQEVTRTEPDPFQDRDLIYSLIKTKK